MSPQVKVDLHQNWKCSCGNIAESSGFATVLEDGTEVEPSIDGPWVGHMKCMDCGYIFTEDDVEKVDVDFHP